MFLLILFCRHGFFIRLFFANYTVYIRFLLQSHSALQCSLFFKPSPSHCLSLPTHVLNQYTIPPAFLLPAYFSPSVYQSVSSSSLHIPQLACSTSILLFFSGRLLCLSYKHLFASQTFFWSQKSLHLLN